MKSFSKNSLQFQKKKLFFQPMCIHDVAKCCNVCKQKKSVCAKADYAFDYAFRYMRPSEEKKFKALRDL